jgi:glycosyltransferase involved in cell wall biosynthesis
MNIVGMAQVHNEVETGHLDRCMKHYSRVCDELVVLDDASTDGSLDMIRQYTKNVIVNENNNWDRGLETKNKAILLENTLQLNPDWIVSFDADEVFDRRLLDRRFLENMLKWADTKNVLSLCFNWNHLWLSECWYRVDSRLSTVSPPRIWKNTGNMVIEITPGLHRRLWPRQMDNPVRINLALIHYSSSSEEKLFRKISNYLRLDPTGNYRAVLEGVELAEVNHDWFENETKPERRDPPELAEIHARIMMRLQRTSIHSNEGVVAGAV